MPVASSAAITSEPAIRPPCASVMIPLIVAVLVCAKHDTIIAQKRASRDIIKGPLLLGMDTLSRPGIRMQQYTRGGLERKCRPQSNELGDGNASGSGVGT